ncbi:MAG: hypothetical protein HFJ44_05920 [Clostridia bacterium]|jgi:hypothetical protein|nr:hypothetical protein [Clostridia bacterium]
MKIKKILKIIYIIIFIYICLFTINLFKKAYIFRKFSKENYQYYKENTNFYKKIYTDNSEVEIWRKENKAVIKEKNFQEQEIKTTYYDENYKYIISNNTVTKNNTDFLPTVDVCPLYANSYFQALIASLFLKIQNEKINGMNCYKLYTNKDSFLYKLTIIGDNTISDDKLYIDKDTWLLIKKESENLTQFFEYKMNVVTEKDVEMPKMHKYILVDET